MKEKLKIAAFEVENVKRVKSVTMTIEGNALTVIGGGNAQGKTSILDAIMWTLGGDRFKPSNPDRTGEKARTKVTLSNGLVAERRGVNGALIVTDPEGKRAGQQLLNGFVNAFALDLPAFMAANDKEKTRRILEMVPGLGAELEKSMADEKAKYDERLAIGRIGERKKKHAEDLPWNEGVPDVPLTGAEMTGRLQAALQVNAENQRKRNDKTRIEGELTNVLSRIDTLAKELHALTKKAEEMKASLRIADAVIAELQDVNTDSMKQELEALDATNARIRQNLEKTKAQEEAADYAAQYGRLGVLIEEIRAKRRAMLSRIPFPLEGLSIDEETAALKYNGQPWDCMSGAERVRVSIAIAAAIRPDCGFVLVDGLETIDERGIAAIRDWLSENGMQAIATRVGRSDECTIIIEDGEIADPEEQTFQFD